MPLQYDPPGYIIVMQTACAAPLPDLGSKKTLLYARCTKYHSNCGNGLASSCANATGES